MSISSCGNADREALQKAAENQARAAVRVNIQPLPGECDLDTPHAAVAVGLDPFAILKLERGQLDKANASKRRCRDVHNAQAKALR